MASTRLPAVKTRGSCPMINEVGHKAMEATRRDPASVNDNKAMSSISPHFPFRHRGSLQPPPSNSPILEIQPEADMKSKLEGFLLCGLESELELSSLENSSGVVTFTQSSSPPVFLHLILTDLSQPRFARSRVT